MESVAQEVDPFGIRMTLVEPGGARTEFRCGRRRSLRRCPRTTTVLCALHCAYWTLRIGSPWRPGSHGGRDDRERRPRTRPLAPMILVSEALRNTPAASGSVSPASRRRRNSPCRRTSRLGSDKHGSAATSNLTIRVSMITRVIVGCRIGHGRSVFPFSRHDHLLNSMASTRRVVLMTPGRYTDDQWSLVSSLRK